MFGLNNNGRYEKSQLLKYFSRYAGMDDKRFKFKEKFIILTRFAITSSVESCFWKCFISLWGSVEARPSISSANVILHQLVGIRQLAKPWGGDSVSLVQKNNNLKALLCKYIKQVNTSLNVEGSIVSMFIYGNRQDGNVLGVKDSCHKLKINFSNNVL